MSLKRFRVAPGSVVDLSQIATDDDDGLDRDAAEKEFADLTSELSQLQELMYAEHRHALLVVLQAMDTGGKDSTIHAVFGPVNAQGCSVANFKAPCGAELEHDYLWRIHQHAPARGHIVIFNRSHYEDVLAVRVKSLVPEEQWRRRYEHINAFERMLSDEGTVIRKFFLHISKSFQKRRLEKRLKHPDKHWKFDPNDLRERARWDDYMKAYEDALSRCSTAHAPWYIIPAETRWYRDLILARVLVQTLRDLKMNYPAPKFDPADIQIED